MADKTDAPAWAKEFAARGPLFTRLAGEVEFALQATTKRERIKTHSVTSRVKGLESLERKCREKEVHDPLEEINDLVGIRVVVLFLSDLPRLEEVIRKTFDVHAADDKVMGGDPASFGYMSVHYVATLRDDHVGPRYDDLKEIPFEIQARTIGMDAWANVSHYLDYKGESSVPEELRKDFFALSGLFYVADQHFEIFAARARESRESAGERMESPAASDLEINLDTLEAFLVRRYPDRRRSDRPAISELVEEVVGGGYATIGELESVLDRIESRFLQREAEFPPGASSSRSSTGPRGRFTDVGAVRVSLRVLRESPSVPNGGSEPGEGPEPK